MRNFADLLNKIDTKFGPFYIAGNLATGSRIMGGATEYSDYDYMLWVPLMNDEWKQFLIGEGFEECGNNGEAYNTGDPDDWFIVRRKENGVDLNLITTSSHEMYDRWCRCQRASIVLDLGKTNRSILFKTMMD